ncbi:hypothetical protein ABTY20_09695 [Streptomyces sp. NPDC126497]|uniref:hypothetical protein n=1 Tax=Streptomyces sp. NPDC126497 TaxID=3155313 RepID=UPI0033319686
MPSAATASGALSEQTWKTPGRGEGIPSTGGGELSWYEVLLAAALRCATLTGVEAAADRVGSAA